MLPYEIVAGVPARHLGWRFEIEIRERLEKIEWWNFPDEIILKNLSLFDKTMDSGLLDELEKIKTSL